MEVDALLSALKDWAPLAALAVMGGIAAIFAHAYFSGREVSLGSLTIGARARPQPSTNAPLATGDASARKTAGLVEKRIALLSSTTEQIQASPELTAALRRFYRELFRQIERFSYGINTCGAEPLRSVLREAYCEQLGRHSAQEMEQLSARVRWYWFAGDPVGFNFKPAFFESRETQNHQQRMLEETRDADLIVALAGRHGTLAQVERLILHHTKKEHGVNLERTPLVLISWFGGAVNEYVRSQGRALDWLMDGYRDLEPASEIHDWMNRPEQLATRLVTGLRRLAEEKHQG
jgi:hypothetical protein